MGCPTEKEYKEAMQNVIYLKDLIARENDRRNELINQLCGSQQLLERYKKSLDYQKEIIQKYEIYQELKGDRKNYDRNDN